MKFRPGAFYPLLGAPLSRITDRVLDMGVVFGREGRALADGIAAESDEGRCITLAEAFLRPRVAALEPEIARIRDLVERMASEREITRVEHAAALAGATVRQLERLFSRYVGATPKWVIKRYRLHEAAERLRGGAAADLAGLAADLGYFDQAHFTRDFKAMVGESPGEYAKDLA